MYFKIYQSSLIILTKIFLHNFFIFSFVFNTLLSKVVFSIGFVCNVLKVCQSRLKFSRKLTVEHLRKTVLMFWYIWKGKYSEYARCFVILKIFAYLYYFRRYAQTYFLLTLKYRSIIICYCIVESKYISFQIILEGIGIRSVYCTKTESTFNLLSLTRIFFKQKFSYTWFFNIMEMFTFNFLEQLYTQKLKINLKRKNINRSRVCN